MIENQLRFTGIHLQINLVEYHLCMRSGFRNETKEDLPKMVMHLIMKVRCRLLNLISAKATSNGNVIIEFACIRREIK